MADGAGGLTLPAIGVQGMTPMQRTASSGGFGGARASRQAIAPRQVRAAERKEFLGNLINEDLQHLTKWHGDRPAHEQKRFLKSVDNLYKSFTNVGQGNFKAPKMEPSQRQRQMEQRQMEIAAAQHEAKMSDPYERPPTPPRGQLTSSHSAPSIGRGSGKQCKPIEVMEAQKKEALRRMNDGGKTNSLEKWLEAGSQSSMMTGTTEASRRTSWTQMTGTTDSSICSEACTMNQLLYRNHKRAIAMNHANWKPSDQNAACYLKDGLGTGYPEEARLRTQFMEHYGSKPMGEDVLGGMYNDVIKSDQHKFVEQFVKTAPPEQKAQFAGMLRSLQFLRREETLKNSTLTKTDFNLKENRRLFEPSRQKPAFDAEQRNLSRVPLGTAGFISGKTPASRFTPPSTGGFRSPSVSDLQSLRLDSLPGNFTPRSLATPLVGGVDLRMASTPQGFAG